MYFLFVQVCFVFIFVPCKYFSSFWFDRHHDLDDYDGIYDDVYLQDDDELFEESSVRLIDLLSLFNAALHSHHKTFKKWLYRVKECIVVKIKI